MLVLSRKVQERICIGDDVEVIITQIQGGRVRIGITAPQSVRILRSELNCLEVDETVDETIEESA